MKTKKLIIGSLLFAMIIMTFAFLSKTEAASSGLGYVKITRDREATVTYTATNPSTGETAEREYTAKYRHQLYSEEHAKTKNVWKLVTCTESGTIKQNGALDLYCLRAGLGFTNEAGSAENSKPVLYDQAYDMIRDYNRIKKIFSGLNSKTTIFDEENLANFNSVMWILDNMILEGATDEEVMQYLKTYAGYDDDDLEFGRLKENVLTRADIEAIQQLAIWYFTNSDVAEYHQDTLPYIYMYINGSPFDTESKYRVYSDIFNTTEQYGTLRQQAAEKLYSELIKRAKAAKTDANGLYIPTREITVYLAGQGNVANEQPLVQVKEKKPEVDVALRKFISGLNGTELTGKNSRAPEVDTRNLNRVVNGNLQTTAVYNHTKEPLKVAIGDIVTYTLRIYNEGEVDTYINEVTDYLPVYLDYVSYGDDQGIWWILDEETGRIATATKYCVVKNVGGKIDKSNIGKNLGEVLIPAAEYNAASDDYTLSYVDVQISCKVSTKSPYDTNITNLAQITKMTDKDKKPLSADRDSTPDGKFTLPGDDKLPSYTGGANKGNDPHYDGKNVVNGSNGKKYYPGQEDDDDFEKIYIEAPEIDLALRKFISAVGDTKYNRAPVVDTSGLRQGAETAIYNHSKEPVEVQIGDVVTYTLRIYNEGEVNGKVKQVKDYLAAYLKYLPFGDDTKGDWWTSESKTDYNILTSTEKCRIVNVGGSTNTEYVGKSLQEAIIPAYDKDNDVLSYIDIEVHCQVLPVDTTTKITNIAEITKETDEYDNPVDEDRDSKPDNLPEYVEKPTPGYKDDESDKPYVPGQEDDDDFEKVIVKVPEIDLSLRKFIYEIDGKELTGEASREPVVDTKVLDKNIKTTAEYNHSKKPITVKKGSEVTYVIRVYNEGEVNAYVSEITDYLPNYLIYLEDNEINKAYGWKYNSKTRQVKTTVTAENNKEGDSLYANRENGKLLLAYEGKGELDYIDVEIVCKVDDKAVGNGILTNLAQITEIKDENGKTVEEDRDSKPDGDKRPGKDFEIPEDKDRPTYKDEESKKPYVPGQEDDDDFEKVLVKPDFDLALRKFITQVGNTPINNRYPEVSYNDGKITYNHTKEPVSLETGSIVTYTIRVYNEGEAAGYANEITDDMPQGLEFLVDNQTNIDYRWKMLDENQEETTDVSKAKYIVTDYLSEDQEKETGRDNKLKAFDKDKGTSDTNPDYRDVKVAFKVTYVPKTIEETKKVIINVAQISKDSDDDIDSKPNRDEEYDPNGDNEDDIDYDNVKVKYFDLSLLKWVAQTKVTLDGKTTITDTGHTAETSKNEEPVKLEIASKDIKKIVIKYVYMIQITNEGEIEGYATEVKDYIPAGLKFEEEDNKEWNWKVKEDGVVTTDYLKDTLLKPGESATVPIVLTWINSAENFGEKVNLAEISKDKNKSNTPDIDSTPDNKKPGEDDIDDAPVILAVKTGTMKLYLGLTSIILITFAAGVRINKKICARINIKI